MQDINRFFSLVARSFYSYRKLCIILPNLPKIDSSPREPLMTTILPNYPWERIATDLFELKGCHDLLIIFQDL